MSRLVKYRESLSKFMNERSGLVINISNKSDKEWFTNYLKSENLLLPTLLLTTMNSQNKKHKITTQGYTGATSIQTLLALKEIRSNQDRNDLLLPGLQIHLITTGQRFICQNLESVGRNVVKKSYGERFLMVHKIYSEFLTHVGNENDNEIKLTEYSPHHDLVKWYLINNEESEGILDEMTIGSSYRRVMQVDKESYMNWLYNDLGKYVEISMVIGWLLGCGCVSDIIQVEQIAKYFTIMYKLSMDFENIREDIKRVNSNGFCPNYIVNFGLQDSYELFMSSKEKFLEETMKMEIYTNTIKEIVDLIDKKVDKIIEETHPIME